MSEAPKMDVVSIDQIASGQKFMIYGILANIIFALLKAAVGDVVAVLAIISFAISAVGVFRVGSGFGYHMGLKIALIALTIIPLINLIVLLILNARATKVLRAAGFQVGLMGVR